VTKTSLLCVSKATVSKIMSVYDDNISEGKHWAMNIDGR
jgi:hypothetical protein